MPSLQPQREFAIEVVRRLRDAGFEALLAGGCVRDELLGLEPNDYDVATNARPEQVRELFGLRRTLAIGAAFGVISILGGKNLQPIEVATFRSDGAYIDGRHPTEVTFTTAEEDAQRRDFTMNGLFFDPLLEKLIDYVGGEQDLRSGIVRAIGDPSARLAEDKLRMLRAVRFATTFDFVIEEATLTSIQAMADEVQVVSAERIGAELRKVLQHPQRRCGIELLRQSALLRPLLPTLADWVENDSPEWANLFGYLENLHTESVAVVWATCFCQTHDADLVYAEGRRLRFTNKEIERAVWLVENFDVIDQAANLPWPQLQRVITHLGADDLLTMATAVWGLDHEGIEVCRQRLAMPLEELNPVPLISGDDLIAQGLQPGRYFSELLDFVRDAQLEQRICDRQQAMHLVEQWLANHPQDK